MLTSTLKHLTSARYSGRASNAAARDTKASRHGSTHHRNLWTSISSRARTNSNKEFHEIPKGVPSTQYHRTSTRYTNTTPELLRIYSAQNQIAHLKPHGFSDNLAYKTVRFLRVASDAYFKDNLVYRAMMLETVAAVPGMVGGMVHHLRSLRKVQHDNWIRTLLDEAENERMHLFCWLEVLKPTWSQRMLIVTIQAIFFTGFLTAYIFMPKTCHRFVGYLEEEAYKTYTHLIDQIDAGKIKDRPAPQLAIDYWNMPANATMRDMTVIIREDEHDHARVNHSMANMIVQLRHKDIVYSDINIDDNVFGATLPGTEIIEHGQVQAISKSTSDASPNVQTL